MGLSRAEVEGRFPSVPTGSAQELKGPVPLHCFILVNSHGKEALGTHVNSSFSPPAPSPHPLTLSYVCSLHPLMKGSIPLWPLEWGAQQPGPPSARKSGFLCPPPPPPVPSAQPFHSVIFLQVYPKSGQWEKLSQTSRENGSLRPRVGTQKAAKGQEEEVREEVGPYLAVALKPQRFRDLVLRIRQPAP